MIQSYKLGDSALHLSGFFTVPTKRIVDMLSAAAEYLFCCVKTVLPALSRISRLSKPVFMLLPVNCLISTSALNIASLYCASRSLFKKKSHTDNLGRAYKQTSRSMPVNRQKSWSSR